MSFLNNGKFHKQPDLDRLYHISQSSFVRQCSLHTSLVLSQTQTTVTILLSSNHTGIFKESGNYKAQNLKQNSGLCYGVFPNNM